MKNNSRLPAFENFIYEDSNVESIRELAKKLESELEDFRKANKKMKYAGDMVANEAIIDRALKKIGGIIGELEAIKK